mmetsp:Transcript_28803/g.48582  ORF Transcript_28803/g.48582 Transcript_28803/m.48582 type:complete len:892 (+) Transcript_28803:25-2700(+)
MSSPPRPAALRELSTQNHYAARQIQRLYRGHAARQQLWSYDGVLTVNAVSKIQRCWRGRMGRQEAAQRYLFALTEKTEIIRGLCRCWKARRILRMKRAAHLNACATMLQCLYRTRTSRKYFQELKRQALKRKATLLQKYARGFVVRRWVGRLRRRVKAVHQDLVKAINVDVKIANTVNAKMSLELLPHVVVSRRESNLHLPRLLRTSLQGCEPSAQERCAEERWNMLHTALCSLVGTARPEFAVDQSLLLLHKYPDFLPGHFVHAVGMLSCWCAPASRSARVIREYYMEEAVAIVLRLQAIQLAERKAYTDRHGLPEHTKDSPYCTLIMNADVVPYEDSGAREVDCLFQLEKMYFSNGFATGGVCTRTLSLMASFVMVRSFSSFGSGMQNLGPRQGDAIGRARRLFDRAKKSSAILESEGTSLRLDVFRNLFECTHESIMCHRKVCHDLHEEGEADVANKKPVQTDLEFYRCGEMLMVRGYIVLAKEKVKSRGKSPSGRREGNSNEAKWTPSKCNVTLRPLVLLPHEAQKVYEQGVVFTMKSLGKSEMDVRQKPKWKLLSEYVMQGIRVHSCGRGRVDPLQQVGDNKLNMQSVVRLSLPCIEYARQERNDIRVEQYCAKLLQRAFRGFQGRALWKRLHMRVLEQKRQKEAFRENFEKMKNLRDWRYSRLALIQSNVKGWYLRRVMWRKQKASVVIQCMVRKYQAKTRVAQERLRRNGGPEVIEMMRRGTEISGVKLMVVIYRCGLNYKIIGHDVMGGSQYQGFVYQPEIVKLIEDYNSQFPGTNWAAQQARIKPWQHIRVAEMLLQITSLTTSVASVTQELGKGNLGRRAEMIFVPKAKALGPGIGGKPRGRILADEKDFIVQFEKLQAVAALKAERAEKIKQRQIANKAY